MCVVSQYKAKYLSQLVMLMVELDSYCSWQLYQPQLIRTSEFMIIKYASLMHRDRLEFSSDL
jgi:hypothetical protein